MVIRAPMRMPLSVKARGAFDTSAQPMTLADTPKQERLHKFAVKWPRKREEDWRVRARSFTDLTQEKKRGHRSSLTLIFIFFWIAKKQQKQS